MRRYLTYTFLIFSVSIFLNTLALSQNCNILFPTNTVEEIKERPYHSFSQTNMGLGQWNGLVNGITKDDQYLSTELQSYQASEVLYLSQFNLNIPAESEILGLSVIVYGKSHNNKPQELIVQLANPSDLGLNGASSIFAGEAWPSEVGEWRYGSGWYTWGMNLTAHLLNDPAFGVKMQLINSSATDLIAEIDKVSIQIKYIAPYSVCTDHACIIASLEGSSSFNLINWDIPSGFEVISGEDDEDVIVIGPIAEELGTFELCATSILPSGNTCCAFFTMEDCTPGSIGNYVWEDRNTNGIQDIGENPLSGIRIILNSDDGNQIAETVSDANGFYQFINLVPDEYFLTVIITDDMTFTTADSGSDDLDSDISGILGTGTSDYFIVGAGENKDDLDIGLIIWNDIIGVIWDDLDADGIREIGEPFLAGVELTLRDGMGNIVRSETTDNSGNYSFEDLPRAEYFVEISTTDRLVSPQNQGPESTDSDFMIDGTLHVPLLLGNIIMDAGLYRTASIGDFVWLDLNRNGTFDTTDSPFNNLRIELLDENGNVLQTQQTQNGNYLFTDLNPGSYTLEMEPGSDYLHTSLSSDNGSLNFNGSVYSTEVTIISGQNDLDRDFGFQFQPSSLTGFTWLDDNGDGLNNNEAAVPSITVNLYSESGVLITSTMTDASGIYSFDQINPGTYYVVFEKPNDLFFTVLNGDSTVENDIVDGATDLITIVPGQDITGINAGYFSFSSLGDFIWIDSNRNGIQDVGEPGIPNLNFTLIELNSNLIIPASTDANGKYSFSLLSPGAYQMTFPDNTDLIATIANAGNGSNDSRSIDEFTGFALSEVITLNSGSTVNNFDFGYQYKPASIGGYTWIDSNANGTDEMDDRLGSVAVSLWSSAGTLISQTVSDANGSYRFDNLNPGNYYVSFDSPQDFEFTSEGIDSDVSEVISSGSTGIINLSASQTITNVNAGYFQRGSIGDYLWVDVNLNGIQDLDEIGIPEAMIMLIDVNTGMVSSTITDLRGGYKFDDLRPSNYLIQIIKNSSLAPSLVNQGNGTNDSRFLNDQGAVYSTNSFFLTTDQVIENMDFGFSLVTASISGLAWNDHNADGVRDAGEDPLSNASIELFNDQGTVVRTGITDNTGSYLFDNLAPGIYYVKFVPISDLFFSPVGQSNDISGTNGAGTTDLITLIPDQELTNIDGGYFGYSSIGDYFWLDANANGLQDATESGMSNIRVSLFNDNGVLMAEEFTDNSGFYSFENLLKGDYYVGFNYGNTFSSTSANAGNGANDSDILDILGTGTTSVFSLGYREDLTDIDGGVINVEGSISGTVFIDGDANGLDQVMDIGYANFTVELYSDQNQLIDQTQTQVDGSYSFNQLLPGDYYVLFVVPTDFVITESNIGTDDTIDSDATGSNGIGTTDLVTLQAMGNISNIDLGIYQYGCIGDLVWLDSTLDGVYDSSEVGVEGIIVSLIDVHGSTVSMTTTDMSGNYKFGDVIPGVYQIKFEMPINYEFVQPDTGNDDSIDSDASNAAGSFGFTNPFMIASGTTNSDIDAGLEFLGGGMISGLVWEDLNGDGVRQTTEILLSNKTVELYDDQDQLVSTTVTDANGNYEFNNVPIGTMYLLFEIDTDEFFTTAQTGTDATIDSDVTGSLFTNSTDPITVALNDDIQNIDAGIFSYASVGDMVWFDGNENGIFDNGEAGVNDVLVELFDMNGTLLDNAMTMTVNGQDGIYTFADLMPGSYQLGFSLNGNLVFIDAFVGNDPNLDSDVISSGTSTGNTQNINLTSGEINNSIDAGAMELEVLNISGFAFTDQNGNGVKDISDIYDNGVTVNLYNAAGTLIDTQITDTDQNGIEGYYLFNDVPMGIYYVEFILPSGTEMTDPDMGTNDALDSDITEANGPGTSDLIDLNTATGLSQICGGYFSRGSIGDFVWNDMINNGIQDPTELGITDLMISLFDEFGGPVDATFSGYDVNGNPGFYTFYNVKPGNYYIRFNNAQGISFTMPNQGTDDNLDSDITGANGGGTTDVFSISSGEMIEHIDAGMQMEPAEVGSFVWTDINGNGIQDALEPGLPGVKVDLYNEFGAFIATQTTDVDGEYLFTNIQPGNYYIVFETPTGHLVSDPDQGGDDTKDSDVMNMITTGASNIFNLSPGESELDIDAGFYIPSRIGDFVWDDLNKNGIQDAGEPGVEGVTVELRIGNIIVIQTTTTDANGFYEFMDLKQGTYSLVFSDLPAGYQFSPMDAGNNDVLDSDPNPSTGETVLIVLAHGVDFMDLDAGIFDPSNFVTIEKFEFKSWPQPAQNSLIHFVYSLDHSPLNWVISDQSGQIIKTGKERDLYPGNNRFIIDVQSLPQGSYTIRYNFEGFYKTKTLIKI